MPRVGKYWLNLDVYHAPFNPGHTWAKVEPDNTVKVGIDDFAQKQAGDLLFVRLFPVGKEVTQGKRFGTLETAKWVGPLIAPVSGKITQINEEVTKKPKLANEEPYGKGWLISIKPSNLEADLAKLVKGDQAVEWMKKDIKEIAKEEVT